MRCGMCDVVCVVVGTDLVVVMEAWWLEVVV